MIRPPSRRQRHHGIDLEASGISARHTIVATARCVSSVLDVAAAERDGPEIERDAAAERDRGDRPRAARPSRLSVFFMPSASSTIPAIIGKWRKRVGVTRQLVPARPGGASARRRSTTSATMSK